MTNASAAQYRDSEITSASPRETVLSLYDGAIDFLKTAIIEMSEKGDIPEKARLIERAVNILDYLQSCLDKESGGEIAGNLDGLYEHMMIGLTEANLGNDKGKVEEVVRLLQTIREGWAGICQGSGAARGNGSPFDADVGIPEASYPTRKIEVQV